MQQLVKNSAMALLLAALFAGCESNQNTAGFKGKDVMKLTQEKFKSVPQDAWDKLASKKIYFGHQSVGKNILAGVEDVLAENQNITLRVAKVDDDKTPSNALFVHSKVGKNGYPELKDEDFARYLNEKLPGKVDTALYKYCYVDIKRHSDVDKVFEHYKVNMAQLKEKHPDTQFIHITAPITVLQTGPKAWLKKIMGKPVGGQLDNVKRAQFREKLLAEYGGKDPIFDLYEYESTRLDGARVSYQHDGKTYYALAPEYTDDGSHLNTVGRRFVAQNFLIFLAENVK